MAKAYRVIETHDDDNIAPLLHRLWHVQVGGKHYMLSYLEAARGTKRPECMAFRCTKDGNVKSYLDVAVSYASDPEDAFNEVIGDLTEGMETMKKITVAYKRFGGEPVAAFVGSDLASVAVDLLSRDVSLADVPVLDAAAYERLGDLEEADGNE